MTKTKVLVPQCSYCKCDYTNNGNNFNHKEKNFQDNKTRYPILLKCSHSACNICIQSCLDDTNEQDSSKDNKNKSFLCKICKVKITVNNGSIHELPIDFYLLGVIKYYEITGSNNSYLDFENKIVVEDERNLIDNTNEANNEFRKNLKINEYILKCLACNQSQADLMCRQCALAYCTLCFEQRHNLMSTQQHEICYNGDNQITKRLTCVEHPNEELSYICLFCNKLVCTPCLVMYNHRGHNASNLLTCGGLKSQIIDKLSTMQQKVELYNGLLYKKIRSIKTDALTTIIKYTAKYYDEIKKLDKSTIDEIDKELNEIEKVKNHYTHLELIKSELNRITRMKNVIISQNPNSNNDAKNLITRIQDFIDIIDFSKINEILLNSILLNNLNENVESKFGTNSQESMVPPVVAVLPKPLITENSAPSTSVENKFVHKFNADDILNSTTENGKIAEVKVVNQIKKTIEKKKQQKKLNNLISSNQIQNLRQIIGVADVNENDLFDDNLANNDSFGENNSGFKLRIKNEKLNINAFEKVKLVNLESPCSFWVRRYCDINRLNSLMADINENVCSIRDDDLIDGKLSDIGINDIVLHKRKETLMWSRAQVVDLIEKPELDDQVVVIYYIDYGNKATSSIKRLKKCHVKFSKQPAYAIHCYLNNVKPLNNNTESFDECKNVWEKEGHLVFQKLCDGKVLDMQIIEIKNNNDFYGVELTTNSNQYGRISIADVLANLKLVSLTKENENSRSSYCDDIKRFIPMKKLTNNQNIEAIISYCTDLELFYMRQIHEDREIEARFSRINEILQAENGVTTTENFLFMPKIGMPCAALFKQENRWYRAEILEVHEKLEVDILYVDYGHVERTDLFELRHLKPEYMKFSVDVFKCKFFGIQFIKEKAQEAYDLFSQIHEKLGTTPIFTKIVNVNYETNVHEIILNSVIDGVLKNINLLFVESNCAICTDSQMINELSNDLNNQFKNLENEASDKVIIPKGAPKPTKLDIEVKDIIKNFDKTIKVKTNGSNRIKYIVSNCISPSEIWIQESSNNEKNLEILQKKLADIYANASNSDLTFADWNIDDLCAYKHPRSTQVKRSIIIEKNPNETFKIVCLDNGMYENNIQLGFLYRLTDEAQSPDFLAKKCTLVGIEPAGSTSGEWGNLAKCFVSETLIDREICVNFKSDTLNENGAYEIEILIEVNRKPEFDLSPKYTLYDEFIKFTDILNSKGLALLNEKKSCKRNFLTSELPIEAINELQFNSIITHLSPNFEVNCYSKTNEQYLINLQLNLNKCYSISNNKVNLKRYETGQACICESNINKGMFYRAQIIEINSLKENLAIVQSVDYGFKECVHKTKLYEAAQIYFNRPALSIKLTFEQNLLKKLKTIHFANLKSAFENKGFLMELSECKIKETNESSYLIINLEECANSTNALNSCFNKNEENNNNKGFNMHISRINEFEKFYIPKDNGDDFYRIEIICLDKFNKLWLKYDIDDSEKLNENQITINNKIYEWHIMQYELNKADSNIKKLTNIETKKLCLSLFHTDLKLYRAIILNKNDEKKVANICYIDYGNCETVKYDNIYELPNDYYCNIEAQAIFCTLHGIKKRNENNNDELLLNKMSDCLFNYQNKYYAKFYKNNDDDFYVDIYIGNPNADTTSVLAYQNLINSNSIYFDN